MKKNELNKLESILSNSNFSEKIYKEDILSAFNSKDGETLGAIYNLITEKNLVDLIDPAISFDECFYFLIYYYRFCIFNNIEDGCWVNDRYSASWDFANIVNHWVSNNLDSKYIEKLHNEIKDIYLSGDEKIKLCIETGFLEHLNKKSSVHFGGILN